MMNYEVNPFQDYESITIDELKDQANSLLNLVTEEQRPLRVCMNNVSFGVLVEFFFHLAWCQIFQCSMRPFGIIKLNIYCSNIESPKSSCRRLSCTAYASRYYGLHYNK